MSGIFDRLRIKLPKNETRDLKPSDVKAALEYIDGYWKKLERYHPKDDENLVGLPKPFLVPSFQEGHEFDYNELYYWDSYFMVQGMLDKEHKAFVMGILDDLVYLYKRFDIIPNGSRTYLTSRSQPPLLTSFIWDLYDAYHLDEKWLKKMMKVAEDEYRTVWIGTTKPNVRQVYKGLSRYYDVNYLHDIAEAESGWDMTPRFDRRALDYLPVDLNALLYKYETDFARYYRLVGDDDKTAQWEVAARHRKETMDSLMWSKVRNLYYDYDFVHGVRGNVASLAAFFPLWAGMVDEERAGHLVKSLRKFEEVGGLVTTLAGAKSLKDYVPTNQPTAMQWAYPNGWAPLHFIVIKGLQRYGYHTDAKRIAMKWLHTNLSWYKANGIFLEKYNVVNPGHPPAKGLYPSQTGFGWTNAVFERFCQEYILKSQ